MDMNAEVFFNIILPTGGNRSTIRGTIESVLLQTYKNYQLIISDNSRDSYIKDLVDELANPQIRYLKTPTRLSMSDNWEFVLRNVDSGWITYLGGDDGMHSQALEVVAKLIKKYDVSVVRVKPVEFIYPDDHPNAIVKLNALKAGVRNSKLWVAYALYGLVDYGQLPVLYNGGFADLAVIRKNSNFATVFFSSINPDIVSGFKVAFCVDRYLYTTEPIIINGASKESNGTSFGNNGSVNSAFWVENSLKLNDAVDAGKGRLPRSIHLCVVEAYLQSLDHSSAAKYRYLDLQFAISLCKSGGNYPEVLDYIKAIKMSQARSMVLVYFYYIAAYPVFFAVRFSRFCQDVFHTVTIDATTQRMDSIRSVLARIESSRHAEPNAIDIVKSALRKSFARFHKGVS